MAERGGGSVGAFNEQLDTVVGEREKEVSWRSQNPSSEWNGEVNAEPRLSLRLHGMSTSLGDRTSSVGEVLSERLGVTRVAERYKRNPEVSAACRSTDELNSRLEDQLKLSRRFRSHGVESMSPSILEEALLADRLLVRRR